MDLSVPEDEFWQANVWNEEDDSEWGADSEDLAEVADEFDSDFFESSSSSDEGNEGEKELLRQEEARKRKKRFDYEKITRVRQQRLANSTRTWSVLEEDGEEEEQTKGRKAKKVTQAMLLAEAQKTEQANLKLLQAHLEQNSTHRDTTTATQYKLLTSGQIRTLFSWSSERKIHSEELKKSAEQIDYERTLPPFERQLYLFSNLSKPKESSFPSIYTAPKPILTLNTGHKYMEPVTRSLYNTVDEFQRMRDIARGADYHALVTTSMGLLNKLYKASKHSVPPT
ncbi:hypothetical protein GNI_028420 [Gregarina niphandrodes]|uniref:Uncharacterized protein n=1 Tax=Gregarina niphandrodes TaxID=110365 RepID=A0A023BBC3_GRENI|nr:hypothetical protein GNI_028420 [Gregarina niphandrodes]EZG79196.1 hypothetical protein GNI_028420 [Gregarina niphandrodes]|eukprot:XP_011129111.1 hypothetical protein GNI_028420 [Gregarina niphandrodes]